MSLVFAAITPHPPLLIPSIGKDVIKKVEKTKKALEKLKNLTTTGMLSSLKSLRAKACIKKGPLLANTLTGLRVIGRI